MLIRDLPRPVTASKADWIPGTTWLGFTPQGEGPNAPAQCASTVLRQAGGGYVLERITTSFGEPNEAFKNHPDVIRERERHEQLRDRLVAVHRLRHSMRPLEQVIGKDEFERVQDIWAADSSRRRWSVAFPIVETYDIVGQPRARDVFPPEVFRRIYQTQSATLRLLDDDARTFIAGLEIRRQDAPNAWIAIEDEIVIAEASELSAKDFKAISSDLDRALEGHTEERKSKIKKRATWLANKFYVSRRTAGSLSCDKCPFDPRTLPDMGGISVRSCFDVHHMNPLSEGVRYTTLEDFALLCATCHRLEHLRLKKSIARP